MIEKILYDKGNIMKKIIFALLVWSTSTLSIAVPVTYQSVYKAPNAVKYDNHHHHSTSHRFPSYSQPHVSIQTPNVRIYMPLPQSQYREQRTEEVYLPYGGTYRKTTEYISQNPRYAKVTPRHRIVNEGRYDSEKAQEQE